MSDYKHLLNDSYTSQLCLSRCICQFSHHWDKILETSNLKREKLNSAHSFRGSVYRWLALRQEHHDRKVQWNKPAQFMVAKKQSRGQSKRRGHQGPDRVPKVMTDPDTPKKCALLISRANQVDSQD